MNKYWIAILLCLFGFFKCFAFEINRDKLNIIINQAEVDIANGEFSEAYKKYKKLDLRQLSLNDLQNFYVLALDKKSTLLAINICQEMANRGIGSTYFKNSKFTSLRENVEFVKITENADRIRIKIENNTQKFTRIIDSVYEVDQKLAIERSAKYQNEKIPTSLLDSFDVNTVFLLKTVKSKGFPVEGNVVPQIEQDTFYYYKGNYKFPIIHCLQMSENDSLKTECKKLIISAVQNYEIPIKDFFQIEILSNLLDDKSLGEQYFSWDPFSNRLWQSKYATPNVIEEINKTRKLYKFTRIEDDLIKARFYAKNVNFVLSRNLNVVIFNRMNDDQRADFLSRNDEITQLK